MRYLINLFFFLSFIWVSPTAFAALSAADEIAQTQNLETLSIAWGNTDPANTIFIKPEYTTADWEEFFNKFFHCTPVCAGGSAVRHSLTDSLGNYLQYPAFYWLGNEVNLKLQMALINPMWIIINNGLSSYPTALGNAMFNDASLRQNMLNSAAFFTSFARNSTISDQALRSGIYEQLKNRINTYPSYFKDGITLDAAQPYVAKLRDSIWEAFAGNLPMTPTLKDDIAVTIGLSDTTLLSSKKKNIWNTFTVLVNDNNGLDDAQIDALNALLTSIPSNIHDLRFISAQSFYYPSDGGAYSYWGIAYGAVEIFGDRLSNLEQQFASDASPRSAPIFMTAAAHEFHHVVDWYQQKKTDTTFKDRRAQLLTQAGNISGQYLRCNIGTDCGAWFQASGGEFIASIANDYITDSWNTLDLAISRFNAGYKEPINQFLMFADTHTQGGLATKIYTINTMGAMTVSNAAVTRDAAGRIVTLRRDDANIHANYQFTLDTTGNVISYRVTYDVPTISPMLVSNIKQTTATLTATVNTNGGAGRAYAQCKSGTADYTAFGLIPAITLPQQPINGPAVFNITGLTGDAAYTCRIGAWNYDFDAAGVPVTFTTLVYPPTVVGSPTFSNIKQTTATMTATVNTNGDPSGGAYAECKLTSASDTSYAIVSGSVVQFSAPVNAPISVSLIGLTANTSYTCRMAAWGNHMGSIADTRGVSGSFTTLSYDPIAVTLPTTLVSKTTATLNGSCDFKGLAGTAKFEYWKAAKVPVIITTAIQSFAASSSTYPVKQAITGLAAATNYTYQVKCTNVSAAVNGLQVTFKTTR